VEETIELEIRLKEMKMTYFITPEELTLIESVLPDLVCVMIQDNVSDVD
jgi:hypothetical protein